MADVFRFVNHECQFLSALTPLQPRYAKKVADANSLMAVIIAQAMNHGNLVMSRTSDIPYHVLETTYQQYLRQTSLQPADDRVSNTIAALPIFSHYSFDLDALYGAVDGQKCGVERPTVKVRYSRKYFGAARAWSPIRCYATTYRSTATLSALRIRKAIMYSTSGIATPQT
jgi:hypothetical protein